jgi:hypothetical protein
MTDRELMQMALDALEEYCEQGVLLRPIERREALRARLAQPEREWQGLTDEEYEAMAENHVTNCYFDTLTYARAIEAKLKEKNNG